MDPFGAASQAQPVLPPELDPPPAPPVPLPELAAPEPELAALELLLGVPLLLDPVVVLDELAPQPPSGLFMR